MNNKNDVINKLKKGLCILLAATCIGTLSACNNKESVDDGTSISIEEDKKIPFKREDGAYLEVLGIVKNKKIFNETNIHVGYITYDKNGTYFENILEDKKIEISDNAIYNNDKMKFFHAPITELKNMEIDGDDLSNGYIGLSKCKNILSECINFTIEKNNLNLYIKYKDENDGVIRKYIDLDYSNYVFTLHLFNPTTLSSTVKDDNMYSLDNKEPLSKINETTMYVDSDTKKEITKVKN